MKNNRIRKQVYTHIPVYSGDVSGAASALYEFGGLTVIHDPSGCNSTYNTFDELRWAKRESAIYISGLRESDAINGNDQRLLDDVVTTVDALSEKPSFIALCNSPVPDIIGTDFAALCRLLEKMTRIPAFYVHTNAMHDYTVGGANALEALAEKMTAKERIDGHAGAIGAANHASHAKSVNLLGLTPFEFPYDEQADHLYDLLESAGFKVCANWGRGTKKHPVSFKDVSHASCADVSLVISSIGIKAAMYLYENYGIPYVIGNPLASDDFGSVVFNDLRASISSQVVKNSYLSLLDDPASTVFIGESVTMGSEAAASALSGTPARLIRTTECEVGDKPFFHGETEIAEELKKAAVIHGDPLFKNARSHGVRGFDATRQTWIDEPHLAMSGRLYFRD